MKETLVQATTVTQIHIYFLIQDPADKGEISTMCCQTYFMLADYFLKTPQGGLFHKFRDILMVRVSPYNSKRHNLIFNQGSC